MRRSELLAELLAILVLGLAGADATAEVYKWVDEQGRVHYGDRRPAVDADADTLVLPPPPARDAELAERAFMRRRLLDAFEAQRREQLETEADARAAKLDLERRCSQIEKQVARFERANVVYTEDDEGERRYMNDDERREALAGAREWIAEHCRR